MMPSVPWGSAFGACEFQSGFGRGSGGAKWRSDDAPAGGVGGIGATPYRAKALDAADPSNRESGRRQCVSACGQSTGGM